MISVLMIDSRSKEYPDWVKRAKRSVEQQIYKPELIVIDNTDKKKSIGKCWNEGVKKAKTDWILFVGDDDFLSDDYTAILEYHVRKLTALGESFAAISTYMTAFDDKNNYGVIDRPATGMWSKDYLLKNPFDEKLKTSVDRALQEKTYNNNGKYYVIPYHFGYFYRQHYDKTCDLIFLNKNERVQKWHYPKLH